MFILDKNMFTAYLRRSAMSIDPKDEDRTGADIMLDHPGNLFNRLSSLRVEKDERAALPVEVIHRVVGKGVGKRGNGKTITEKLLIGVAATIDGPTKAAREYGVTRQAADAYMNGQSTPGPGAKPTPELMKGLDNVLNTAKEHAADRILKAIDVISDKAIADLHEKPLVAASLASTLAGVVEKLTPRGSSGSGSRVAVIVHTHDERREDTYEKVEVPLTAEER